MTAIVAVTSCTGRSSPMRLRKIQCFATIGSAFVLGLVVAASADEGHEHGAPLHGGKVAMTKE